MANNGKNDDERLAKEWLKRQGHTDIRSPASDPPDYLIDGRIAVEVTRLNQRIRVGNSENQTGEEKYRIPLDKAIEKTLKDLAPGDERKSWTVDCEYNFSKSPPKQNDVEKQIRTALLPLTRPYDRDVIDELRKKYLNYDKHADELADLSQIHLCLSCGLCLELAEFEHRGKDHDWTRQVDFDGMDSDEHLKVRDNLIKFHNGPPQFIRQNLSDGKGIGIAEELINSVRYCISDKSEKIRKQNKVDIYEEWWLVLVDHICHVPMQILSPGLESVRDQELDFWCRVVIISSNNSGWCYELYQS